MPAPAEGGLTLRDLGAKPVTRSARRRAEARAAARGDGDRDRARSARRTTRAATTTDEPSRDRGGRARRRGDDRRRGATDPVAADARPRRTIVEADVYDGTGATARRVLQPAVPREAAHGGHRGLVLRQGRPLPGQAPDDEPGRRRARASSATRRACSCPCTPRRARPTCTAGSSARIVARRARTHRAAGIRRPARRRRSRRAHELVDRTDAFWRIHRPETIDDVRIAAHRLKFDEFLRMQVGLVARKRALEREHSGIAHDVDGPLVPRSTNCCPFPLTDDQRRAIDEIRATSPRPRRCTACSRARSVRARRWSRSTALLDRGAGRLPGCVHGADRGARRAARPHDAAAARRPRSFPTTASLLGERPVRVELLTNRTSAADRRRIAEGLRAGCGRHRRRHPHAHLRGRRVRAARAGRHRRAAPLRRRAARPAPREGRRARRARHDRDADPAHRGDAHLRRPRQVRAARAARPGARRSSPRSSGRVRSSAPGVYDRVRAEVAAGPPGLRRLPARRGLDQARGARRPPTSTSGSRPRTSPVCGSVCCTARCRRPTRRRSCGPSATTSSTCSSRRR